MKVFLAALIFIGMGVVGMCFNIIFRRKDFPQFDVGANEEMQKRGIKCMREVDEEVRAKGRAEGQKDICNGNYGDQCEGCGLAPYEKRDS